MANELINNEYLVFTACAQKAANQLRGEAEMDKALDKLASEMKRQAMALLPNMDQSCYARFLAQVAPLDNSFPKSQQ